MNAAHLLELLVSGIAIGCIYSLVALGFTLVIRATGVLNFAQGETVMLGAMFGLSVWRFVPQPFVVLFVIGAALSAVVAIAIELGVYRTLRLRRVPVMNVIIATIAMSILLEHGAHIVWGSEPMPYPRLFVVDVYAVGPVRIAPQMVWIIVLALSAMVALQLFLRLTRTGRAMQAAAQDPDAAQLMGINLTRTTTWTYAIAGALGGGAGVLLGSLFYAAFNMGFLPGIKAFVAATIGGLGSVGGAMIGGVVFGLVETFSALWVSTAYKDAIGMALLIVVLTAMPQGIAGLARRRR